MSTVSPHAYVEDPSPGAGRLRPRAYFRSDAPLLELDGAWRFRLAEGLDDLTARPWTIAALDAATHTVDLWPDGDLHLHLEADHHGIGSAACGPLLPAPHTLAAVPTTFTIGMTPC